MRDPISLLYFDYLHRWVNVLYKKAWFADPEDKIEAAISLAIGFKLSKIPMLVEKYASM